MKRDHLAPHAASEPLRGPRALDCAFLSRLIPFTNLTPPSWIA